MAGITYDRKRVSEISRAYDYYIDRLFDRYIDNMVMYSFAMGGFVPSIPDDLMKQFHRELLDYITSGIKNEWDAASVKNEQIAFNYIKNLTKVEMNERGLKMFEKLRDKLQDRNTKALNAFINRKKYGKTLSNRVWNLTKAFKRDTEVAMRDIMELGITDGTSASELATELKKYLKQPNKLYRRVRKEGKLTLSKQAKAYHPGMGVYRSSYKNALRLTRTEINQAYRFADYNKIQDMDFVVGIEIIRSSNPYDCDICESLKGKYPKDFLFVGHHPNCYSDDTEVLTSKGWKLFRDLNGEKIFSLNPLTKETEYVDYMKYMEATYVGHMYRFKGQDTDMLVTPEHVMVYWDSEIKTDKKTKDLTNPFLFNTRIIEKTHRTTEHYSGMVYDIELERNHILYTRRNGKCVWGSNCRCIVKTITATNNEFLEVWNKRMNGVDAPMKSKNEVTNVPKAYREYAKKYQNKIKSIKKMAN